MEKTSKIQNYKTKINWEARILCLYLVNNTEGSEFLVLIWLAKLWGHASSSYQKPVQVVCSPGKTLSKQQKKSSWRNGRAGSENILDRGLFSITECLPLYIISHQRLFSILELLPLKVIFHKRCFPSNIVFHQSLCSITGCLPLNAVFQQRLPPGMIQQNVIECYHITYYSQDLFTSLV